MTVAHEEMPQAQNKSAREGNSSRALNELPLAMSYVCASALSCTIGAGIGSGAGLAVGVAPPSRPAPGSLEAVPVPLGRGAGAESGEAAGPLRDGFSVNVTPRFAFSSTVRCK